MSKEKWAELMPYKKPDLRSMKSLIDVINYLCKYSIIAPDDNQFSVHRTHSALKNELGINDQKPMVSITTGESNLYIYRTNNNGLTPVRINIQRWRKAGRDDTITDHYTLVKRDYIVIIYKLLLRVHKKRSDEIEEAVREMDISGKYKYINYSNLEIKV
ncbi:hypothetical protein [Moritella viscosa]|uniref:hypothetical protein n=1 Tax=Moritella viscosa TaxID=80854 RepID=UPI000919B66A|nr:hypothetical protein [Moritella viscosa]SGZ02162.1 Putative uncharacterized protein [Moritella viscosa]